MKDNVILIGMPGAGKSTVGVVLAKTMGMKFIDSDLVIQNRENRLLQNMINEEGMEHFLDCEEQAVLTIEGNRMVVATGCSVIYRKGAMEHLRALGRVVYLDVSHMEIERRVNNITTRGIALRDGATLKDIYKERAAYYNKYLDVAIGCDGKTVENVVDAIVAYTKEPFKRLSGEVD